jgi:hypothetical protein
MIMFNIWDFGVSGLYKSSDILKITAFLKQDVCPQEEIWEAPTLLGLLERANLSHWYSEWD